MSNVPAAERTYVENPEAFLDDYSIEDHIRDIDYVITKLRQFISSSVDSAPGFLKYPKVSTNSFDMSKLDIESFGGLDSDFNPILFAPDSSYGLDNFEAGKKYYIGVRISKRTTDDKRVNERQRNRKYNYILREEIDIVFLEDQPITDLCIGTYTVNFDTGLNTYVATYTAEGRSALLNNSTTSPIAVSLEAAGTVSLEGLNINSMMHIHSGPSFIYGRVLFAADGTPYSFEYISGLDLVLPENPDTIFVSGEVQADGRLKVTLKNNYLVEKNIMVAVV